MQFGRVDAAAGLGNVKQAAEKFFQNRWLPGEHLGDLRGVGLKTGGFLAGVVKQLANRLHFFWRNLKHVLEGLHLFGTDMAVGLGHLGPQHDDGNGKRHLTVGDTGRRHLFGTTKHAAYSAPATTGTVLVDHHMTGIGPHESAQRPAHGEPRHTADDLAPNAHACSVIPIVMFRMTCLYQGSVYEELKL